MKRRLAIHNLCTLTTLLPTSTVESWTYPSNQRRNNRPIQSASSLSSYNQRRVKLHASHTDRSETSEEECLLIPEPNPNSDPHATSLSSIPVRSVSDALEILYPPRELQKRNAASRTDGYWKYIERGEEPPREFTYGEFDVEFLAELLDIAWGWFVNSDNNSDVNWMESDESTIPWKDRVFMDIGSGTGRLVLAAAALHPNWKKCRGLEILKSIHDVSLDVLEKCKVWNETGADDGSVQNVLRVPNNSTTCQDHEMEETSMHDKSTSEWWLAPIQFTCGSFADPYQYLGDVDCAFVFSSCMKPPLLKELSMAIGRQFRPGSIVITTEFPLVLRGQIPPLEEDESMPHGQYELELLQKVNGWCWLMGGESTAYIHRVTKSLWSEYAGPRRRKESLEEEAWRLVQLFEKGELGDPKRFYRDVMNNLAFHGISLEDLEVDAGEIN